MNRRFNNHLASRYLVESAERVGYWRANRCKGEGEASLVGQSVAYAFLNSLVEARLLASGEFVQLLSANSSIVFSYR